MPTRMTVCPPPHNGPDSNPDAPCFADRGASLVEMLIAVALMGTVVAAVVSSVFVSVNATAFSRDHAKAQQWLQSAVGVIEAVQFSECNPALINGKTVQKDYQDAVSVGKVDTNGDGVINSDDGAKRPWQYQGTLTVMEPEVWDGGKFVPFDSQSVCYDQSRLRQQRVKLLVQHPDGVNESVEMIKVDR
jgi:type II secretory pathway pseudopilin PulG